ncbi:MAG: dephospho-CoA kinase [Acidihalobacter sp.]
MLRIGLTGGIGSGKSTVADCFAHLGIAVIDSDVIARELVLPGSEALQRVAETFGLGVLRPDGSLDRAALRRRIFDDEKARRQLEEILHPRIRQELQTRAATAAGPYVVLVIPLLVEHDWIAEVDRVLVVDCSPETQIRRTTARDHVSPKEADAVLRSQASREQRLACADDVIDNDSDRRDLDAVVAELDRRYRQIGGTQ